MADRMDPIVSVSWLAEHLNDEDLVVLNATLPKAGSSDDQLQDKQIPGARFLNIKQDLSDTSAKFPNTRLSADEFEKAARKAGINKNSVIVVYDEHGLYSAARVWWQFKSMGHKNIFVLDGGLPAAINENFELLPKSTTHVKEGDFVSLPEEGFFVDIPEVRDNLKSKCALVVDARSAERYSGKVAEPRPGLRSGHIPASENLPFAHLLASHKLKDKQQLSALFKEINPSDQPMIMSCGSGITACILALGAELAGYQDIQIYDGSWTEWGSISELPIETSQA